MTTTRDDYEINQDDLVMLLDAHPDLSTYGYGHSTLVPVVEREDRHRDDRAALLDYGLPGVRAAAAWLRELVWRGRVSGRSPSSYSLKHDMENTTGVYVCNGEFIAAALLMGAPVDLNRRFWPNPRIGVSAKRLKTTTS